MASPFICPKYQNRRYYFPSWDLQVHPGPTGGRKEALVSNQWFAAAIHCVILTLHA